MDHPIPVGSKFSAVKVLNGLPQAQAALLDQVHQQHTPAHIPSGKPDDPA